MAKHADNSSHVGGIFRSPNIVPTTGSRANNPSGILGDVAKAQVVANDQTKFKAQGGNDSFSKRSPKASVKVT